LSRQGEILAISESQLRTVVQTDSEIMEIFMRAFIFRRMGLIATEQGGDVILVGSTNSSGTLRLVQFFDSYTVIVRVEGYRHGRGWRGRGLARFNLRSGEVPVSVCVAVRVVLRRIPSTRKCAACLGMNPQF